MKTTFFLLIAIFSLLSCDREAHINEDVQKVRRTLYIYADPSFFNITQELTDVYEGINDSVDFKVIELSEDLAIKKLVHDSATMVISGRNIYSNEAENLQNFNKVCHDYVFGHDAIAFITSKSDKDTIYTKQQLLDYISGQSKDKKLVFDENYSSTIKSISTYLNNKPMGENSFAAKNSKELFEIIKSQKDKIGICGSNVFSNQDDSASIEIFKSINIIGVKSEKGVAYPFQADLASKKYPFSREIHILNAEHYYGPYSGFKNYCLGPKGQRVVLKSGLLPFYMPSRLLNFIKKDHE